MKSTASKDIIQLEDIPNVGPASAADLRLLGISKPSQLKDRDGFKLYNQLCKLTGVRHDPCVIDVFLSAIYFIEGKGTKPWWKFSQMRKERLKNKL